MSLTSVDPRAGIVDDLDAHLREAVRARNIDPQRDGAVVRRLVEDLLADHDRRSLSGSVLPVENPQEVLEELVARLSGFGPLQRYLDDPTVEEVWINEPGLVR